ncbi:hypothetical protein LUZ61_007007 [Rhynchospora tenuis]|uniref:ENTH domain-containing protein n=1 Tax=Rhynchospora tenuis TaxID=198213 RepID=A0AAD6EW13_9POAL|nr:hypothetical protein LUZ61_007007 [Rhynchospora tenuis]
MLVGTPIFDGLKQQASFYLKEKIRTARLVLTDVTPVQLLVEEVTSGNPCSPDAKTMGLISRSAFDCDEYIRIIHILHRRLSIFEWENWREAYNSLVLLEHLLTRGPESIAIEFQGESSIIEEMLALQHVEKGFNWGLAVKNKAERVLKLLKGGTFLKEERERARRLAQGIEGFGSWNRYLTSTNSDRIDHEQNIFCRTNSQYEKYTGEEREYANRRDEEAKLVSSNLLLERENQSDFVQDIDHPFYFEQRNKESLLQINN